MNFGRLAVRVVALSLVVGFSAQAQSLGESVYPRLTGSFTWYGGGPGPFYVPTPSAAGAGSPAWSQFGAEWDGPVDVWSATITMSPETGRNRIKELWVYTSPTADPIKVPVFADKLTEDGLDVTYMVDFAALNGGSPIRADQSYLMFVIKDTHGSGAYHIGIQNFSFVAAPTGPPDVNVNLNAKMQQAGGLIYHGTSYAKPEVTNNGRIGTWDSPEATYWSTGEGEAASLTALYGDPIKPDKAIGSIGLGFSGDRDERACPQWVIVTAEFSDGTFSEGIRVDIPSDTSQYGRYTFDPIYKLNCDIVSLTITMPPAVAGNWYGYADGAGHFGITEFQAFAVPVPEPATMSLLALGGLALLRRR